MHSGPKRTTDVKADFYTNNYYHLNKASNANTYNSQVSHDRTNTNTKHHQNVSQKSTKIHSKINLRQNWDKKTKISYSISEWIFLHFTNQFSYLNYRIWIFCGGLLLQQLGISKCAPQLCQVLKCVFPPVSICNHLWHWCCPAVQLHIKLLRYTLFLGILILSDLLHNAINFWSCNWLLAR